MFGCQHYKNTYLLLNEVLTINIEVIEGQIRPHQCLEIHFFLNMKANIVKMHIFQR